MSNQVTTENLQAELARLRAENEALKTKKVRPLTLKVSEKTKAISVYGLTSRYPVTLYRSQMERLLAFSPEIQAFIRANESKLATQE
jgi:hypothetical protein